MYSNNWSININIQENNFNNTSKDSFTKELKKTPVNIDTK